MKNHRFFSGTIFALCLVVTAFWWQSASEKSVLFRHVESTSSDTGGDAIATPESPLSASASAVSHPVARANPAATFVPTSPQAEVGPPTAHQLRGLDGVADWSSRFSESTVLDELIEHNPETGYWHHHAVHETTFKYPLIQTESIYESDALGSLVRRSSHAWVADHLVVILPENASIDLIRQSLLEHELHLQLEHPVAEHTFLVRLSPPRRDESRLEALNRAQALLREHFPHLHSEVDSLHAATGLPSGAEYADFAYESARITNAWDLQPHARKVIVGVIDSGIALIDEITPNLWRNAREDMDAWPMRDRDGNGYLNDEHGYDFYANTHNLTDPHGHGTRMASIIGAPIQYDGGAVGVAVETQLMILRYLGPDGYGTNSDSVRALDYARTNGAKIVSCSWGGGSRSTAFEQALSRAGGAGVLVIASAGNDGKDNDAEPHYPSSYTHSNMLAVTSFTSRGRINNYGATSVDMISWGAGIYSLNTLGVMVSSYGTSSATAVTSGVAALLRQSSPTLTASRLKSALMDGGYVHQSHGTDYTLSGRRLDALGSFKQIHGPTRPTFGNPYRSWRYNGWEEIGITKHLEVEDATTIQWYRNGVLLPNETQSSVNIAEPDLIDAPVTYTIKATNNQGTTTFDFSLRHYGNLAAQLSFEPEMNDPRIGETYRVVAEFIDYDGVYDDPDATYTWTLPNDLTPSDEALSVIPDPNTTWLAQVVTATPYIDFTYSDASQGQIKLLSASGTWELGSVYAPAPPRYIINSYPLEGARTISVENTPQTIELEVDIETFGKDVPIVWTQRIQGAHNYEVIQEGPALSFPIHANSESRHIYMNIADGEISHSIRVNVERTHPPDLLPYPRTVTTGEDLVIDLFDPYDLSGVNVYWSIDGKSTYASDIGTYRGRAYIYRHFIPRGEGILQPVITYNGITFTPDPIQILPGYGSADNPFHVSTLPETIILNKGSSRLQGVGMPPGMVDRVECFWTRNGELYHTLNPLLIEIHHAGEYCFHAQSKDGESPLTYESAPIRVVTVSFTNSLGTAFVHEGQPFELNAEVTPADVLEYSIRDIYSRPIEGDQMCVEAAGGEHEGLWRLAVDDPSSSRDHVSYQSIVLIPSDTAYDNFALAHFSQEEQGEGHHRPWIDADSDGLTNYQEFILGTMPREVSQLPRPSLAVSSVYAIDYVFRLPTAADLNADLEWRLEYSHDGREWRVPRDPIRSSTDYMMVDGFRTYTFNLEKTNQETTFYRIMALPR